MSHSQMSKNCSSCQFALARYVSRWQRALQCMYNTRAKFHPLFTICMAMPSNRTIRFHILTILYAEISAAVCYGQFIRDYCLKIDLKL